MSLNDIYISFQICNTLLLKLQQIYCNQIFPWIITEFATQKLTLPKSGKFISSKPDHRNKQASAKISDSAVDHFCEILTYYKKCIKCQSTYKLYDEDKQDNFSK